MKKFKLSGTSKSRLNSVNPKILEIIDLALSISRMDFGIPEHGGLRTTEEQNILYYKGLSKCDGKENISKHQSGEAFDIFAYKNGKASWDKNDLTLCAAAILQAASILGYGLEWGGNWKTWQDYPHFQLKEEILIY